MRRLYEPRPVTVFTGDGGDPDEVAGRRVTAIREQWVVEDGWWASRPLCRRYFELVLEDGSDVVVFHESPGSGDWFRQRA